MLALADSGKTGSMQLFTLAVCVPRTFMSAASKDCKMAMEEKKKLITRNKNMTRGMALRGIAGTIR